MQKILTGKRMPADKMVSYPMQNNGSLDEEAFFFAQGSAHCGVPRALPFGNPQTFVYKSLTKTSVLHFLRKYKGRICPRVYHAKKAQHGAVLFWRGESIKKGSGKRNVFFLSEHITLEKAKKQHLNCKVQNFFTNLRKVLLWKN